ncbi:hypothetical protein BVY03_02790 [bacterium K02(2017)]|nr:hypothetical protein BVY03_02790 [bacterium K02(2017)]
MLTNEELNKLKNSLLELKTQLTDFINNSTADSAPVELSKPIGRLSRMDEMQQQQMHKANRLNAKNRLTRVESALLRFKNKEYGYCNECEDYISFKRLMAKPESLFCLDCQQSRE